MLPYHKYAMQVIMIQNQYFYSPKERVGGNVYISLLAVLQRFI